MTDKTPPGFMLYEERQVIVDYMSDESAGKLFKALFAYSFNGEVKDLDPLEAMAFLTFKADIDRGKKQYAEMCKRNEENGKKGGRPRKPPEE